jgi:hypothetical protein
MNFKIFQIPYVYTIWDGLSLKTISRHCSFKLYFYHIPATLIHVYVEAQEKHNKKLPRRDELLQSRREVAERLAFRRTIFCQTENIPHSRIIYHSCQAPKLIHISSL